MNAGWDSGRVRLRWLLLGALAVRLACAVGVSAFLDYDPAEEFYDDLARHLLAGHGYVIHEEAAPSLYRPPLYPLLLAGVFRVCGAEAQLPVFALQMGFDLISVLLVFLLARDLLGRPAAVVATALYGLYPFPAYYAVRLLTESLFTMLLLAGVYAATRGIRSGSWRWLGLAGAALGLATLSRFSVFYGIFLLAALVPALSGGTRRAWGGAAIMLGVALLAIAPWTARNHLVSGRTILLGTGSGYNLWLGNHAETDGRDNDELNGDQLGVLKQDIAAITRGEGDAFTVENDPRFAAAAVAEFREHPAQTVGLVVRKAFRFWFDIFLPGNRWFSVVLVPVQAAVLALALAGFALACARRRAPWVLAVTILYFNGIHAAIVSTFRYCVPVMPFVLILAGYLLAETWGVWRRRRGAAGGAHA
jgi:4-amino-4-deoxy-L-arabinose transferase-like glycosyltransferase